LGRQLAFELLLHRKLRRRQRRTDATGARVRGAEAAACDGGTQMKPTSGSGGTRAARRRSSRATVTGQWRLRLRRCLRLRQCLRLLAVAAARVWSEARVCEC
jgi:hypothetical protein